MTHQFSLSVHAYLTEKIKIVEFNQAEAKVQKNSSAEQYCEGQLQELTEIRRMLSAQFDLNTDYRQSK